MRCSGRDPVGNSAPRVVLRSVGHSERPQSPWRRRRRTIRVGKARVWRNKVVNSYVRLDDRSESTTTLYIHRVGSLAMQVMFYISELAKTPNSSQTRGDLV
jgi:hypothetical protein